MEPSDSSLILPTEIIIEILANLEGKDLWGFARTCAAYYKIAKCHFLFKSLTVGNSAYLDSPSLKTSKLVAEVVFIECGDFNEFVRKLELKLGWEDIDDELENEARFEALERLILCTPNVESVVVHGASKPKLYENMIPLFAKSWSKLISLRVDWHWHCDADGLIPTIQLSVPEFWGLRTISFYADAGCNNCTDKRNWPGTSFFRSLIEPIISASSKLEDLSVVFRSGYEIHEQELDWQIVSPNIKTLRYMSPHRNLQACQKFTNLEYLSFSFFDKEISEEGMSAIPEILSVLKLCKKVVLCIDYVAYATPQASNELFEACFNRQSGVMIESAKEMPALEAFCWYTNTKHLSMDLMMVVGRSASGGEVEKLSFDIVRVDSLSDRDFYGYRRIFTVKDEKWTNTRVHENELLEF